MNLKRGLIIILVVVGAGWVIRQSVQEHPEDELIRDLVRERQQQEASEAVAPVRTEPSSDMVVSLIPEGKVWFVGKYEDGGGVEIPFQPGYRPEKSTDETPVEENPGFVGAEACQECHEEKYHSFLATGHYKTSRPVNEQTIDGRFDKGFNGFQTSDPNVSFEMIHRGNEFLQQVHFFDWSFEVPMEIIMGSSKMAQTYLYWHRDRLYQHNVTHITDGDQWINSPGYIDGDAAYARPIPQRCLDCHLTYFDYRGNRNRYTPGSLILGVTCERCHGPAEGHVNHHRDHRDAENAVAITNPADLDRKLQMDICGQCHGGSRELKGDALSFRPGDPLEDHYFPPDNQQDAKNSVHTSNQLNRLAESVCFQQSQMTCVDCHDPHHNERGDDQLFSNRCMTCHENESDCGYYPQEGVDFGSNCIDCHMPRRSTENLRLESVEGDVFPPLRDHKIRIDEAATQRYLESLQGSR
ncbi:cytochrome c family protein [Rhodopirellula halodulae]|uniref:cytochrome c family protein n=1 Tax=Rhodopirellula halodulae TaxID=2894198 RepID=UPI001E62A37E|nr:cytochrome c family protein [Rhodopirellula sp. JC737]MCC9655145.1 cytochrome c family protein [Rhodopirellula sp. JC737]